MTIPILGAAAAWVCPKQVSCAAEAARLKDALAKLVTVELLAAEADAYRRTLDDAGGPGAAEAARNVGTIKRLQSSEETQRRANDHLERENATLRALCVRHRIDYASALRAEEKKP